LNLSDEEYRWVEAYFLKGESHQSLATIPHRDSERVIKFLYNTIQSVLERVVRARLKELGYPASWRVLTLAVPRSMVPAVTAIQAKAEGMLRHQYRRDTSLDRGKLVTTKRNQKIVLAGQDPLFGPGKRVEKPPSKKAGKTTSKKPNKKAGKRSAAR